MLRRVARPLLPAMARQPLPAMARAPLPAMGRWTAASIELAPGSLVGAARGLAKGKNKKEKKGKGAKSADVEEGPSDSGGGGASDGPKVEEKALKEMLAKPLEHLLREYKGINAGRAVPTLLDTITLDLGSHGGVQPLPQLAKILVQGPQSMLVTLYNIHHVNAAVAAIERSPLNLLAEPVATNVKVQVPRPTRESREVLAKHVKVLAEAAKTATRGVRQRAMKSAKSEATKEEIRKSEKLVEAATQAAVAAVEEAAKEKEKKILTF